MACPEHSLLCAECSSNCVMEYLKLNERSFSLTFLKENQSWALLQEFQADTDLSMFRVQDLAVSKLPVAPSQKHQSGRLVGVRVQTRERQDTDGHSISNFSTQLTF